MLKIAIVGAGGVGGYLGGRLAHAGMDVTFIARGEHLQALRERGLRVLSPAGDFVVKPAHASDEPAQVGSVDLILFCTKTYDARSAAQHILPMIGRDTALVPVLNGIDHIDLLGDILGAEHVLGGLAAISTHKRAPGVVEQVGDYHRIEFGDMDGTLSPRAQRIEQTLRQGGINATAIPNIVERMWRKLVMLSGVGMCSVVRAPLGVVRAAPETFALMQAAMRETLAVAAARHIALSDSLADELAAYVGQLPVEEKPSMLVDVERGNRLEVEWLNGAVSRMGKELGVPTPVNDFIYACLKPWSNGVPQK